MTYVPGFDHDIFLSYAHNDNTVDGTKPRWVKSFGEQLSAKLLKQCGETVDVWWDDSDLDRDQVFDDVIPKAVKNSAILISLLSPSYTKRNYCKKELDWFAEPGHLKTPNGYLRIFSVQLFRLPFTQWPAVCQGTSGFEFFDSRFDRLSRPLDVTSDGFADAQWKLVSELATVLDEMRQLRAALAPVPLASTPTSPASSAFRVFLACSSDELNSDRTFLKKQLLNEGIEVISKIPPPDQEQEHEAAVVKAVQKANLCIHLLGESPGRPFDEDNPERTFPVAQANIALQSAKPQLVLMPELFKPDLIEPGPYADFLKDLQARPRQQRKLQIIKAGRQQFLQEIMNVKRSLEEQAATPPYPDLTPRTAFVDLHLKDLGYVTDLIGYLAKKEITAVTVPCAEQSPTAGMAMFEQYLKNSQWFIVVFGEVARSWVANRVAEAFKLIVTNGFNTRMGIYVAPPEKPPRDIQFGFCDVMLNTKTFNPATIDALLNGATGAHA